MNPICSDQLQINPHKFCLLAKECWDFSEWDFPEWDFPEWDFPEWDFLDVSRNHENNKFRRSGIQDWKLLF